MQNKPDTFFKFNFKKMELQHGVELNDGFFELYSCKLTQQDIEQLQFVLWSIQQELDSLGQVPDSEYKTMIKPDHQTTEMTFSN
jgi:hypothetical protein